MLHRIREWLLGFGAYPEETPEQRGRRRLFLGISWLATVLTIPSVLEDLSSGFVWVAGMNAGLAASFPLVLAALTWRPRRFPVWVHLYFGLIFGVGLVQTVLQGGLLESGLEIAFNLAIAVGALIFLGWQAAVFWFAAFVASIALAVWLPTQIDPLYEVAVSTAEIAVTLVFLGLLLFAAMLYFARQRDRFQRESDDLLHNILPAEIALRLKQDHAMIADSFDAVSVVFADVVDFTPMSSTMPADELVGLLNEVFTAFDRLAEELGMEKIKTVGDEYMAAAGVPNPTADHAAVAAELALRMRRHVADHEFGGRRISLRIGINSGPVTAGIIGTHKFAYDLWGDTVNTASRMESGGVAGAIQISSATYDLIADRYECEARGSIDVKGKGAMTTYLLLDKRPSGVAPEPV